MLALIGGHRRLKALFLPLIVGFIALVGFLATFENARKSNSALLNGLPLIRGGHQNQEAKIDRRPTNTHAPPKRKPTPAAAPPVKDPFPLLASSSTNPPPIPAYNVPSPELHRTYGIFFKPPLFIGFTRQWPILLQCVVSYITAGWPPESIIVVENTGVQFANQEGRLSLQNPFYLNYTTLRRLGVTVLPTPVLLTFSQMQNFFLATAHARNWPYYFYSHQDVMVMSFEDGADPRHRPGDHDWFFYDDIDEEETMRPPAAGQQGYRTIYENCLRDLNRCVASNERWAFRWYQYDHLALINREAMDAVGGYDSLIPYYMSDCDMNARLELDGWEMKHRRVGIINDVSTVLEDLGAMYRDETTTPRFLDPNPPLERRTAEEAEKRRPEVGEKPMTELAADQSKRERKPDQQGFNLWRRGEADNLNKSVGYFRELLKVADDMSAYKYREDNHMRNTWQSSQHGGMGEPYYYNPDGFQQAFWILADAGREVYRQKWGHRDCDLVEGTAIRLEDQWLLEKDWEDPPAKEC